MRDISRTTDIAAMEETPGPNNWQFTDSDPSLPKTDIPGAVFATSDLEHVLASIGRSRQALDPVIAAGLQFQKNTLSYVLKKNTVDRIHDFLNGDKIVGLSQVGPKSGELMAFLLHNGIDGATADEDERRERRAAVVDLLSGVASMPDIPDKAFVKMAGSIGSQSLSDKMKKAAGFARSQGQAKASDSLKKVQGQSAKDWGSELEKQVQKSLKIQAYNAIIARGALSHDIKSATAPPHSILHKDPVSGKYDRLLTAEEIDSVKKQNLEKGNNLAREYDRWLGSGSPRSWAEGDILTAYTENK
jgi:hypothetical protein